ncbi:hypothetical protein UAW_02382 [Enterococcus haemoperoxidus ATCC BAA-382]|uniref:LPXTG-domain-containing protein cell wall anchor domain n=1 Tax=Enterococcus haemoperoxidus ATCC BAA-382 TaxID=1158608 RepID=R2SM97_9ENTE|nr:hypothetical protein [Enterococcus haemoperoxidus]EOH93961.1 hypothetical protein UAW_02382 [Enterococcus haemoperoxidus ATCC BAA-382]EOT63269.1 hypothetical protein I583_00069 [Enterococcus haemoperoxidus ATCC BAA-382]
MKRFSCHIIIFILLAGCGILFQDFAYATTDVEIHGRIGGNERHTQPSKEPESKTDTKLAQPKQTHIELTKFPNTGSIIEQLTPIGLLLLLIYLLLNRWKAHRHKRLG